MSFVRVTNLSLRDGQQSTLDAGDWVLDARDFVKVIGDSARAGFCGAEVAGGQSFQIAIGRGYNPFRIVDAVSHAVGLADMGERFELQMLFRGANALGFRHYDKDLLEVTLREFIRCGITKVRSFDALNDIDNLALPESLRGVDGVVFEGAVCFTHYADFPERYTDGYFVRYAEALVAAGYGAIAIKDMSGQLTAERVGTLVPALLEVLRPQGISLTLHCHSTNGEVSRAAIARAVECGVDGIETTEGVLAGGSAHHDLMSVAPELVKDEEAYGKLRKRCERLWGDRPERRDLGIDAALRERLCAGGVPGGAMPFVIRDLEQQQSAIRAKYEAAAGGKPDVDVSGFDGVVDLFLWELKRVCVDAGLPLLVTPTADICCKQAIANLAFGREPYGADLAGRYLAGGGQGNPDVRFAKLILGYYGELKAYDGEGGVFGADDEVVEFFEGNNPAGLVRVVGHPSEGSGGTDLRDAQEEAWQLIQRLGANVLSFASFDQLTILCALKPAGGMQGGDAIGKAIEVYLKRAEASKIDGRGRTFPGYEMLMQPVLSHLGAMFAVVPGLESDGLLGLKLGRMGRNFCSQLFDIYIDLPIWPSVTVLSNHLSKLLSSEQISAELLEAVRYVGGSLAGLDLRPERQEKGCLDEALERFEEVSVAELFNSLALLNSFVNDVAKYATSPKVYAERSLGIEDIGAFAEAVPSDAESAWERGIRKNITGKYLRLEADFVARAENWGR